MIQKFTFDNPIPSCRVCELKFTNNKWQFVYFINTPQLLLEGKEYDLCIYEFISNLILKERSTLNPESTNISIKSLNDYLSILQSQREADIKYRKEWLSKHPDAKKPSTITLENKSYSYDELKDLANYIVGIQSQNQTNTTFIGI